MSRSEDYLDNLLTSVTDKLDEFDDEFEQNRESLRESYQTQNDLPSKTQSALDEIREENFLREFEDEINKGKTDDDFLSEFERELNGGTEDDLTQRLNREEVPLSEMDADLEDFFKDDMADDLFADPGAGSGNDFLQNPAVTEPEPMEDFGPAVMEMDTQDPVTMAMDDPQPATMAMDDLDTVTMAVDDLDPVTMAMDDSDSITMAMDDPDPAATAAEGLDAVTMAMDTEPATMAVNGNAGALDSQAPDRGEDEVSKMAKEDQAMEAPKGMEGLEDIFGDILDEDADSLLSELEHGIAQSSDDMGMTQPAPQAVDDSESLTDILNGSDEEALSEIDRLLDADDGGQPAQGAEDTIPMGPDFSFGESALGDEPEEKKKKSEIKTACSENFRACCLARRKSLTQRRQRNMRLQKRLWVRRKTRKLQKKRKNRKKN